MADHLRVSTSPDLPTGAVRLLTDSLASANPRLRWVCALRAAHAAWVLRDLGEDRARVVTTHDGDDLVGVAIAIRYDAGPSIRQLFQLVTFATVLGMALSVLGVNLALLASGPAVATVAATIGAMLLDGSHGLTGAREAQRRAADLGADRCWGRGLVGVAASHRGQGIGTDLTRQLVASLPTGDTWLPVALTERAGLVYTRLGARRLGGAASELVAHPSLGTVPDEGVRTPAAGLSAAA